MRVVAFLLALLAAAAVGSAPASAYTCKDVMFVGARGSGESAEAASRGMGPSAYYMAKRLEGAVRGYGETLGTLPVIYRADSVKELVPSESDLVIMAAGGPVGAAAYYYRNHLKPYVASIDEGIAQTVKEVGVVLSNCPETEIVLAGYSQGAMVVRQAQLRLERTDEEAFEAIGGALLLGDGDRTPNSKAMLVGGAPSAGKGVRTSLPGGSRRDVAEPETTVEICAPHDLVCDFSLHVGLDSVDWYKSASHVHTHYIDLPQRTFLDQGVDRLAREMGLDVPDRTSRTLSATRAASASYKSCPELMGYAPKNGGYGFIIELMRVHRVGCERAAKTGGAFYAGDPMPPGWRCQTGGDAWTSCRFRHSHRKFRFIFGGDAG
jgi:hypothetical protein